MRKHVPVGICVFVIVLGSCGSATESVTENVPTPPEEQVQETAAPTLEESAPEATEFLGEDVFFDRFLKVLATVPQDYGFDSTALPTKQSGLTRQFSIDQVNPGRCTELATFVEVGFDARGGPMQYVITADSQWSKTDNAIAVGQSRADFFDSIKEAVPNCEKFKVERDSPAVINFTPTKDTLTYTITKFEPLGTNTVFVQFTASGQAQVDTSRVYSSKNGYMAPKELKGYLMARQEGDNLAVFQHVHFGYEGRRPAALIPQSKFKENAIDVFQVFFR